MTIPQTINLRKIKCVIIIVLQHYKLHYQYGITPYIAVWKVVFLMAQTLESKGLNLAQLRVLILSHYRRLEMGMDQTASLYWY